MVDMTSSLQSISSVFPSYLQKPNFVWGKWGAMCTDKMLFSQDHLQLETDQVI